MKRRGFLLASSAAGLSAAFALFRRAQTHPVVTPTRDDLVDDPKGILRLRRGFQYRIIEKAFDSMDDGYRVPARPDAMGCFALPNGQWALLRNHELDAAFFAQGPYRPGQPVPPEAYNPHNAGCVTRVVLNARSERVSSNLVLTGTARNCAGGLSPWGWLSCEESNEPGHGYVFLCPADAARVQAPQRIVQYGRFVHEAVAIDPGDHSAYLTEDRADSCLYRFVPARKDDPFAEGKLEALCVAERPRFDLGAPLPDNAVFHVTWTQVPHEAGEANDALRAVAQARGAARIRRGEGIWRVDDGFAFTATSGGPIEAGQIFHLAPTAQGGTLRLLAQSRDPSVLDMPDNLTVTPSGDLLVCEDNQRSAFLRIITRAGDVLPFAQNMYSGGEFAGVCFTPDQRTLFVNLQEEGLTLAIEGPFA